MNKKKHNYYTLDEYCLRTPVLSFSSYNKIISSKDINFKKIISNSTFKEAVFLASPELYDQVIKWEKGKLKPEKEVEKLKISVLKYYTRMSTRCTPFGLFAACSHGVFKKATTDEYPIVDTNIKRVTKLDNTFISLLFKELLKIKSIKKNALFYPNTSIYKIGNHYRYIEFTIANSTRKYSLEGFNYNTNIADILKCFKGGKTIFKAIDHLKNDENSESDLSNFIDTLISYQILVSELEINVTGEDSFKLLLKKLSKFQIKPKVYGKLEKLSFLLKKIDDTTINTTLDIYNDIIHKANEIVPEFNPKYLFQTDCYKNATSIFINKDIQKKLNKAFVLLNKMTLTSANRNLVAFCQKFSKRFEQREVPLNLALDFETGIGYGTNKFGGDPFLINTQNRNKTKRYKNVIWRDIDSILQSKLLNATKKNSYTIQLNESDLSNLPNNFNDLPDTTSSIIEIYKGKNGNQIFIKGIGGSSAINLIARFAHGNKDLSKTVEKIKLIEEQINSNVILAEIVHLPEARTGNILHRSFKRNYEISYLGKSSVKQDATIFLEDIMVSVKNNKIILRSKRLNKIIKPILSNAHNYKGSLLPVYNFLCDLQEQEIRSNIGFKWNTVFYETKFLPRVVFENIILSKARWYFKTIEFKQLFNEGNLLTNIKKWQNLNVIPTYIDLVEGDNKLLINLQNEYSIKMLYETIKNKKHFIIEEFLFKDSQLIKDINEETYCNQFVVTYYNKKKYEAR